MIAFGCSITAPETYDRSAGPGIRATSEADSEVFAFQAAGSIFRSYNLMIDKAKAFDDLEALVLVHQDAEIVDPEFCAKLRRLLDDPEVGVVGCLGAVGAPGIAWWEGQLAGGSSVYRYVVPGRGDMPVLAWSGELHRAPMAVEEVDTLDGFMMALSPWAVRTIRFDESLGDLYGYDFDYCLQVREGGRKVLAADLRVAHHHELDLVTRNEAWISAHMRLAEKWEGRTPHVTSNGTGWKERARRAEAQTAQIRLAVESLRLRSERGARAQERRLTALTGTRSWRATEALRQLNAARRWRGD